jgi:hypothetical protein
MIPAMNTIQEFDMPHAPVALLISQEPEYLYPIREYLASFGCAVISQLPESANVDYCIIAGMREYVEAILAEVADHSDKVLGIVWNELPEQAKQLVQAFPSVKFICGGTQSLSSFEVSKMFRFFFTGIEPVLAIGTITANSERISKPIIDTNIQNTRVDEKKALRSLEVLHENQPNELPPPVHEQTSFAQASRSRSEERGDEVEKREDYGRIQQMVKDVYKRDRPTINLSKISDPLHKVSRRVLGWQTKILLAILIILFPFLWYGISLGIASMIVVSTESSFTKGSRFTISAKVQGIEWWTSQAKTTLAIIKIPFSFLGNGKIIRDQERILTLLSRTTNLLQHASDVIDKGSTIAAYAVSPNAQPDTPILTLLDSTRQDLSYMHNELAVIIADLSTFGPGPKRYFEKLNIRLSALSNQLDVLNGSLGMYKQVAGFGDDKRYLVLFQNSTELRPTGGFIGSLAIATIGMGKMKDIHIQDVYDVDGQLKGHVDPPRAIRELLTQEHWYLRDSNWNPDFSVSGKQALWFYEKETNEKLDGVVAISMPVITDLLRVMGPVDLPDYNDRITADNFFGKSLFYTQTDYFPGSTQKKNFLGTLATALLLQITSQNKSFDPSLFSVLYQGYIQHSILVYADEPQAQSYAESAGWAGIVPPKDTCTDDDVSCTEDWVYQSEANVSMNKANYFMKRTEKRSSTILETGQIRGTVEYMYTNSSSSDVHTGGGDYRPYIQYIFPKDVRVTQVTVGGVPIPFRDESVHKPMIPPYTEELQLDSGYKGYGVVFDIPHGETKTVLISYEHANMVRFGPGGAFVRVRSFKQPGFSDTAYSATLHYPINWIPVDTGNNESQPLVAKDGQLEYNSTMSHDHEVHVRFIR